MAILLRRGLRRTKGGERRRRAGEQWSRRERREATSAQELRSLQVSSSKFQVSGCLAILLRRGLRRTKGAGGGRGRFGAWRQRKNSVGCRFQVPSFRFQVARRSFFAGGYEGQGEGGLGHPQVSGSKFQVSGFRLRGDPSSPGATKDKGRGDWDIRRFQVPSFRFQVARRSFFAGGYEGQGGASGGGEQGNSGAGERDGTQRLRKSYSGCNRTSTFAVDNLRKKP